MAIDVLLGPWPIVDELIDRAIGPQGATGHTIGAWSSATTYAIGDVVSREKGGIIRLLTSEASDNLNNDPATDDGTWWRLQVTGIPIPVTNKTGAALDKGMAVYISGAQGSKVTVDKADASDPTKDTVIAVLCSDLADNASGYATTAGLMYAQDTSAWIAGNILYLSATVPGTLTTTAPSAPDDAIEVAHVVLSHANQGVLLVHVNHDTHQYLKHTLGIITSHRETIKTQTNVSGNIAIDCNDGNVQEITLNGNMTGQTFSNVPSSGTSFTLAIKLIQDAVGTRTAIWNAAIDWGSDGAPTISTTANYWDWIFLTTTDGGTSWEGTYRIGYGA